METNRTEEVQLAVTAEVSVKGCIGIPEWWPSGHRAAVVLAHHTSANMDQDLVVMLQRALLQKGFLSIRFNFPYAEQRKKRPDSMPVLEKTYRAAVEALLRDPQDAPAQLIFAGFGLGARVASQAIAGGLKADGLICVSYPLHPSGKPNQPRADALFRIICPILFVQGSRDAHCRIDRLELLQRRIGAPTQISVVRDVDHNLSLVKRSSRTEEEVQDEVRLIVEEYLARTAGGGA